MQERELKIELKAAQVHTLENALGEPRAAWLQENIYLDTSDGALRGRHLGLRLRAEWVIKPAEAREELLGGAGLEDQPSSLGDPSWTLTLKGPSTTKGALHTRSEHELSIGTEVAARIRTEGLAPHRLDWPPLSDLVAPQPALLLPLGAIRTHRRRFDCPGPKHSAPGWLDLDTTLYPDGSRGFELELELVAGTVDSGSARPATLAEYAEALVRTYLSGLGIPWRPSREGKFSRFLKRRELST